MKKSEIITLLEENEVKTSNLNSFISKSRKALKSELSAKKDQIKVWLEATEKKAAAAAKKAAEMAKAKSFGMSRAEMLRLEEKAEAILSGLHTGHSMGCYRRVYVNGELFAEKDTIDTYANSCKYSPTYGTVLVQLNKAELRRTKINEEKDAGGFITRTVTLDGKTLTEKGEKQHYHLEWK